MKGKLMSTLISMVALTILFSGCNKTEVDDSKEYTVFYKVYQKNAYSDVSQIKSTYWPVHTTTSFQSPLGSYIQLNHGTDFSETDKKGNYLLQEIKTYTFTATAKELVELEQKLVSSACDFEKPLFLDLAKPSTNLENKVLNRLADIVLDDVNFSCHGAIKKDSLMKLFNTSNYASIVSELGNCTWKVADWKAAFNTALSEELATDGLTIDDIHTGNNDAFLQTELIKHFISTGEVLNVENKCDEPRLYFDPS